MKFKVVLLIIFIIWFYLFMFIIVGMVCWFYVESSVINGLCIFNISLYYFVVSFVVNFFLLIMIMCVIYF